MTETLENTFEKIRALPPDVQAHVQDILTEMLEAAEADATFDENMKDPAYRAYVEQALAESADDVAAGRTYSGEQILARHRQRMKDLHG